MSVLEVKRREGAASGRAFYLAMALIMAGVILAGFGQTYPASLAAKPALPFLLHLHGAVFIAWVALFVAQPALAVRGSMRLHRTLGWVGVGLAATMVVMGFWAVRVALIEHIGLSFLPKRIFVMGNLITVLVFAGLVAAGIATRRAPEWHKRLMLCATIALLSQALGRLLPMDLFGAAAPAVLFGVVDLFAFAGPAADLALRRRIHPAYAWGVGAILLMEVLIPLLAFSPMAPLAIRLLSA
ncbi:MAG: hypothetical protein JSS35_20715 [Proteobacteria bacterium]|nr:hypothetical protein [Pseudomonadota bacterium]